MLHHHHRHRRPSAKKARASPSSSYSTRCLLERKIYAFDQGHIKDGLRVVQEKAAAVGRVLTEEEKALADSGRGVALAIQDEQGRRYSVFWRSRGFGSTHYMMSGGGWAHFAENHRLHTGDVLRFCFSRAVPRADSGKLYLGVRVLKSAPVTAGGDLAVKTTGKPHKPLRRRSRYQNHRRSGTRRQNHRGSRTRLPEGAVHGDARS
ncbi:unnamed protein product [Spirodela intermedia]|uniref:TF-B3 domain-containing protein n=1 Tax=Spirodela intermedia TaxID=51605 RepID=A0A7I8IE29_SPIIN|nr:unnamed protein product [Spirodela intermedia]CAA6655091.1 unnamed protein product [Spirodela intermedia]